MVGLEASFSFYSLSLLDLAYIKWLQSNKVLFLRMLLLKTGNWIFQLLYSFVTAYLNAARKHFQEKVAEMNVIFYDTQLTRSTRRVIVWCRCNFKEIITKVIQEVRKVPYVMDTYEDPWETFNVYLENKNIEPAEASGLMFYYYLLDCLNVGMCIIDYD